VMLYFFHLFSFLSIISYSMLKLPRIKPVFQSEITPRGLFS
jgi:hypothetical protein